MNHMHGSENTEVYRDGRGRFRRGNPGRPRGSGGAARLRRLFREHVGEDRFRKLLDALLDKAEQGDAQCLRLALGYLLGRPESVVDLEHLEAVDAIDEQFDPQDGADWQLLDDEDANDADDADGNDCGFRFVSADELLANLPDAP